MNWAPNLDRIMLWWTLPIMLAGFLAWRWLGLEYLVVAGIAFALGYALGTLQTAWRFWREQG